MLRRPLPVATLFILVCAVGFACGGDESSTGGGSSSSSSSSTSTSSSSSTSGTGGTGGSGGGLSNQEKCDQGQAKLESCGAGAGGAPPCDDRQACRGQCMIEAPCTEIQLSTGDYATCMGCCDNPGQC